MLHLKDKDIVTNIKKNAIIAIIIFVIAFMTSYIITIFSIPDIVYANTITNDLDYTFEEYQRLTERNNILEAENKTLKFIIEQYSKLLYSLNTKTIELQEIVNTISEDKTYIGEFTITYYCVEDWCKICGGGGITASGTQVTPERSIAVDTNVIPFGTIVYIDNIGYRIAEDRGGAIKGNKIDICVAEHNEALELGRQKNVKVWIVNQTK